MTAQHRSAFATRPTLPFVLLLAFLAVVWLAGGGSRADLTGQVIVRAAAWIALTVSLIFSERPALREFRPVAAILLVAIALPLLQLIPLPPALWLELPGRAALEPAALLSNQVQPWRPLSIVPGATTNALSSLVVPLTVLLLVAGVRPSERAALPGVLLLLIVGSTMLGLIQFSGGGFNYPFVNDQPGFVNGTFANRNHFALFVALGCALAPVWTFLDGRRASWRGPVTVGLLPLFALTILASGSRAGILVGMLALLMGLALTWKSVRREFDRYPRWVFPALIAGVIGAVVLAVAASFAAERAMSIQRALTIDTAADMRQRGLGTVMEIIRIYFPTGSGLGAFDPIFRMHEPFDLLQPTYFNHAHNDFFEIVLDAGVPGLLLMLGALCWWGWASVRVWRTRAGHGRTLPRLGSALLLLVMIASVVDYPARTPLMMSVVILAACWLSRGFTDATGSALPTGQQHL